MTVKNDNQVNTTTSRTATTTIDRKQNAQKSNRTAARHLRAVPQPVELSPSGGCLPSWQVLHGDCLERMRELPDNSIDSVITDPPYGLSEQPDIAEVARCWLAGKPYQHKSHGFMGQKWDSFVPGPEYWEEAMRVLKPGGHLLAFSAPRCYDVLVLALRFAGFEIRDSVLAWVYGQGMPKSHSVSKNLAKKLGEDAPEVQQWQGWGTGLKPAQEPVVVARKPAAEKSISANMLKHGVGAINIDGTRIGGDGQSEQGRWPANFMLVHSPDCQQLGTENQWECVSGCPVSEMDSQARVRGLGGKGGVSRYFHAPKAELPIEAVLRHDASAAYYCPKPSAAERDAGLNASAAGGRKRRRAKATDKAFRGQEKAFAPRDTKTRLNPHTTVKPAGIMLWLATLVTPRGGVILDPFCGSGSTGAAVGIANADPAHAPGWSFIGIEADFDNAGFVEVARQRIRHAAAGSMTEAAEDLAPTTLATDSVTGEMTTGVPSVSTHPCDRASHGARNSRFNRSERSAHALSSPRRVVRSEERHVTSRGGNTFDKPDEVRIDPDPVQCAHASPRYHREWHRTALVRCLAMNDDAFAAVMGSGRGSGPRLYAERIQEVMVPAGWDQVRFDIDYEGECLVGYVPETDRTATSCRDFEDSMYVVYAASLDKDEQSEIGSLRRPAEGPEPEFLRFNVHPGGLLLLAYDRTPKDRKFHENETVRVRFIHRAEE